MVLIGNPCLNKFSKNWKVGKMSPRFFLPTFNKLLYIVSMFEKSLGSGHFVSLALEQYLNDKYIKIIVRMTD